MTQSGSCWEVQIMNRGLLLRHPHLFTRCKMARLRIDRRSQGSFPQPGRWLLQIIPEMAIWICLSEGVICPVNILPMPLPVCLSAERENFCQMRKTLNYSVRSGWSQTRFMQISQEMVGRICFLPRSGDHCNFLKIGMVPSLISQMRPAWLAITGGGLAWRSGISPVTEEQILLHSTLVRTAPTSCVTAGLCGSTLTILTGTAAWTSWRPTTAGKSVDMYPEESCMISRVSGEPSPMSRVTNSLPVHRSQRSLTGPSTEYLIKRLTLWNILYF